MMPMRPTAGACNVYGSAHGGALWTVCDYISTLHASAIAATHAAPASRGAVQPRVTVGSSSSSGTGTAAMRYHSTVSVDTCYVCRSTLVSCVQAAGGACCATFQVDVIPVADGAACGAAHHHHAPWVYDAATNTWRLRPAHGASGAGGPALPTSTATRGLFCKSWW